MKQMLLQTKGVSPLVTPTKPKTNSEADVTKQQTEASEKHGDISISATVSQTEQITKDEELQVMII